MYLENKCVILLPTLLKHLKDEHDLVLDKSRIIYQKINSFAFQQNKTKVTLGGRFKTALPSTFLTSLSLLFPAKPWLKAQTFTKLPCPAKQSSLCQ